MHQIPEVWCTDLHQICYIWCNILHKIFGIWCNTVHQIPGIWCTGLHQISPMWCNRPTQVSWLPKIWTPLKLNIVLRPNGLVQSVWCISWSRAAPCTKYQEFGARCCTKFLIFRATFCTIFLEFGARYCTKYLIFGATSCTNFGVTPTQLSASPSGRMRRPRDYPTSSTGSSANTSFSRWARGPMSHFIRAAGR